MQVKKYVFLLLVPLMFVCVTNIIAQTTAVGDFEGDQPAFWHKGAEPGGSTLEWATDQFRSMGRSLKITKEATAEAAVWESDNMVDIWSPQHLANVDIKVGAYVRTENVNTNPQNDDQRWWISYTFYNQAGSMIGETKLPIDQTTATSNGWIADTNGVGETILPEDSWRTVITFVGGKDATGTVWADDFIFDGRGDAWAGQNWNTSLGVPQGWYYWLPPIGGNDGQLSDGYENTIVTSEEAHSGQHSLKFDLPANRRSQDGFVGTKRVPLEAEGLAIGDKVRISVWIKGENLVPDSAAANPVTWAVGFTTLFLKGAGNNDGYDVAYDPGDMQFVLPHATQFDWRQFYIDVTIPDNPEARALEVRLHVYSRFVGTVYFDDLKVEKLEVAELNMVGGFEGNTPAFWHKGAEPGGSTLEWATDQFRSMGRSLKITKEATAEAAVWESDNMVDIWSPQHLANVDIKVGAYVRTENVNTNPQNDDQRWWISYTFYNQAGTMIGETKLPIDQTTATSSGWIADTNGVGETILPEDSWRTVITFVGGKDATGTVWADDFIFDGRGDAWAGQNWNTSLGVPQGWYYWLPPIGGNDGQLSDGYENTIVTTEEAHSGQHSLKFDLPANRRSQDGFVGTKRVWLNGDPGGGSNSALDLSTLSVDPGDVLRISVWIKGENLVPDSAAANPVTWAVGFTTLFLKGAGNNDGYDVAYDPGDMQFVLPHATQFDWKQFYIDVTIPDNPEARALEVRLHVYSRFVGTVYFDDLKVEKLEVAELNMVGGFEGNTPAFWHKGAEPGGSTLEWATDQFRSMGRSLKITKEATAEAAVWESDNMVDIWSPQHLANVDIKVGAYVRTENVNTNPQNDDQRWWISYTFYNQAGSMIGETKLPIDQTTATSNGWIADTNGVGETILPEDSWRTVITFVGGKDATGTVWADDFIFDGRGDAWAGQNWNTSLGVPQGWYYWLPPIGGNDGQLSDGYENTIVTTEEAHSGQYSLKFDLPANRRSQDGFVGTKRVWLNNGGGGTITDRSMDISMLSVNPGDVIRISVWIKGENLVPDSAAANPVTWAVGFTTLFLKGAGNNDGYDVAYDPGDMQFVLPNAAQFDWKQFYIDIAVPDNPEARALEVRLHVYSRFVGTVYFDDLEVKVIGKVTDVADNEIPQSFNVAQNFPNPFNPSTTIKYSLPENSFVTVKIFDMLGREVKTLVNTDQNAGNHNVVWNADTNYGSRVSSGIYFYKVEAGKYNQIRKMILLK